MGLGTQVKFLASPPKLYEGAVTANWQSGVATSGEAGADFLILGTASTVYFTMGLFGVPIIYAYIGDLTPAATITYRAYATIFGVMRLADHDDYVVGVDPNIMAMYAWVERGQVRIEIQSDDVGDNGAAIPYEYSLKTY
ncbi:unnamed protein product [marine sediment metagenome]|uniref:Uncharacterized protein n=1 Tax=marine sediment metagenome TaxID=412755 RepID=X1I8J8_9ZZZZ